MKEILCNSAYFGVTVSLIGYGAGIMLKKKFKYAFLNPLLISIIFVIGVVMLCGVDYESYENSAQYLGYLLTPATVCLAVPLYQQMTLLKKNLAAVACGEYATVQECADKLIKIKSVTEPDPALVKKYAARYELWHKLYPALKPLYAEMEALQ